MNKMRKISLVSAVGGVFIGKYLWLDQPIIGSTAMAQTADQSPTTDPVVVPTIAGFLLFSEPDFNRVPGPQNLIEDSVLSFNLGNNNLIQVQGSDLVSSSLSVDHGVLTISNNTGFISNGANGSRAFTISGSEQDINDALATLSYQPDVDFNGIDTLHITSVNAKGETDTDSVDLIVSPADDGAPNAIDDVYSTELNTVLTDNVTENDVLLDEAQVDQVINAATTQGGTISIDADGTFIYNPANNFVGNDSFVYTLRDADGDVDTASIDINAGIENDIPLITIADSDGQTTPADNSVVEASASLVFGSFTVAAGDGIADLTLEGNDIATAVIIGSEGTLSVTSFNQVTGVINYSFAEDGNAESHNAANDNVEDAFTISVIDTEADESTDDLVIRILDTAPTAASDSNSLTEDAFNIVTGDVIVNDTQGADTAVSVIAVGPSVTAQVGIPFQSTYGMLDLNSDGTYTYTLDNGNAALSSLDTGEIFTELFTYVITDTDGDTSSALLTVTINGTTD